MTTRWRVDKVVGAKRGYARVLIVLGQLPAALTAARAPQIREWWTFLHADALSALRVTVVNETDQSPRGAVVAGDMGFSLPLGETLPPVPRSRRQPALAQREVSLTLRF